MDTVKVCEMCKYESADKHIDILHGSFDVCIWCADILRQYAEGRKNNSVSNVFFGFGRISYPTWVELRELIRENNIKEILEFGTGTSTELFIIEGVSVISCDTLSKHVHFYRNIEWLHNKVIKEEKGVKLDLIEYEQDRPPNFELLYPGKRWDLVFVDGGQSREKEIESAMKYSSKFIFLDDIHMDSGKLLSDTNWIRKNNLFERNESTL